MARMHGYFEVYSKHLKVLSHQILGGPFLARWQDVNSSGRWIYSSSTFLETRLPFVNGSPRKVWTNYTLFKFVYPDSRDLLEFWYEMFNKQKNRLIKSKKQQTNQKLVEIPFPVLTFAYMPKGHKKSGAMVPLNQYIFQKCKLILLYTMHKKHHKPKDSPPPNSSAFEDSIKLWETVQHLLHFIVSCHEKSKCQKSQETVPLKGDLWYYVPIAWPLIVFCWTFTLITNVL